MLDDDDADDNRDHYGDDYGDVTDNCQHKFVEEPFAWVSAKENEGGRTSVTLEKLSARKLLSSWRRRNRKVGRVGRQNLLSNTNKPLLK